MSKGPTRYWRKGFSTLSGGIEYSSERINQGRGMRRLRVKRGIRLSMMKIERMIVCLLKYKSTQIFQGVFKQLKLFTINVYSIRWVKEKTLPKVSPFIVWSFLLSRAKSWLYLGLGQLLQ